MSRSRAHTIRSASPSISAPAVSELKRVHKILQESIGELNSTVSTLQNLIDDMEKDQQERNRLAKSGTLVL